MNNRRDFFLAGAGASAGLLAAGAPLAAAAKSTRRAGLPAAEDFQALVGQTFVARTGTSQRVLKLEAAHVGEAKASSRPVSLVLSTGGPVRGPHQGALFDLHHASTGKFTLRLEASGRDARGVLFRADILSQA